MAIKNKNIFSPCIIPALLLLVSCGEPGKQKNNSDIKPIKMDTLISSMTKIQIAASMGWGNEKDKVAPILNDAPSFGYTSDAQKRKTYGAVYVKSDEKGGMHIMKQYINYDVSEENDIPVAHFSPEGKFIGKTALPQLKETGIISRRIFDYVADSENNIYVLEGLTFSDGKYQNRFVKINSKGEIVWDTRGEYSESELNFEKLKGAFAKLLLNNEPGLFIVPSAKFGWHAIAQINTETGKTAQTYSLNEGNDNSIYINDNGQLARAFFLPEQNELFYGFYDTNSKTEKDEKDSSRFWGEMKGFDNNDKAYTYTWYNGFRKLSVNGSVEQELLIRDVIVRNDDQSIYTNWVTKDSLFVTRYKPTGQIIKYTIKIPGISQTLTSDDNYRLVHVDEKGGFYFHTGEAPGAPGKIIVIAESGEIVKEMLPPFDLFSIESNFHFTNIHIDPKGNIFLPVTDPQGIKIVKLNF